MRLSKTKQMRRTLRQRFAVTKRISHQQLCCLRPRDRRQLLRELKTIHGPLTSHFFMDYVVTQESYFRDLLRGILDGPDLESP